MFSESILILTWSDRGSLGCFLTSMDPVTCSPEMKKAKLWYKTKMNQPHLLMYIITKLNNAEVLHWAFYATGQCQTHNKRRIFQTIWECHYHVNNHHSVHTKHLVITTDNKNLTYWALLVSCTEWEQQSVKMAVRVMVIKQQKMRHSKRISHSNENGTKFTEW